MNLDDWLQQAWTDHGKDPEGVWARIEQAVPLEHSGPGLFRVAHLACHVAGEHLGRWDDGERLLERLASSPGLDPAGAEAKGIRRLRAVLDWCAGRPQRAEERLTEAVPPGGRAESVRARMFVVAAAALAHQGRFSEASSAFESALDAASYGPDAADPAARELAIGGNNLACELETRADLDDLQRALLLRGARTGRRFWEIAGTWLEVGRAEYRLALSHVAAGIPAEGVAHASAALRVADENGADPLERFFAFEAMARVRIALREVDDARVQRDAAAALIPSLAEADRELCRGELAKLEAALSAG